MSVREGETIAAALFRAGLRPPYFCGIGVCFACLVTVNGHPAPRRACLDSARPDDEVTSLETL
ncbi:MAG TPA: 2Fe-2S iron-sulfur cluster-binding protein [Candidatus Limnocylindrales bacterium]